MATTKKESPNIYQRMHAVMAACERVGKDGQVKGGGNYKFVTHDAVTTEVRRHLVEHGVVALPTLKSHEINGNRIEAVYTVRFVNIDDPSEFVEIDALGFGIDTQDKGPGKAASYAVKYAMSKAFSLPTGDDPERDSIEHQPKVSGGGGAPRVPSPPKKKKESAPEPNGQANGKAGDITREDIVRIATEHGVRNDAIRNFIAEEFRVNRFDDLTNSQKMNLAERIVSEDGLPDPQGAV